MMQRVYGVLAALVLVGGSAACSSSGGGGTPVTDSGKADSADTGTSDTAVNETGETGPVCGKDVDCTTGKTCASVDDCDVTGNGIALCYGNTGTLGAINPTAICVGYDQNGDYPGCAGTATDSNGYPNAIKSCDGDTGLCWEFPSNGTPGTWECDAPCITDATGKFTTSCTGKNSCSLSMGLADSSGNFGGMIGTCGQGCSTNADCPSGNVCDPMWKACLSTTCGADATNPDKECATLSAKLTSPLGPAWKCDTTVGSPTKGYCGFHYAKNPGDACNPKPELACATNADCTAAGAGTCTSGKCSSPPEECWCITDTAATSGFCSQSCTIGHTTDCPTGFTCDALFNATDSSGAALFPAGFKLPDGTSGYCMKDCTADSDCGAGQKCEAHGGMTQKTCL